MVATTLKDGAPQAVELDYVIQKHDVITEEMVNEGDAALKILQDHIVEYDSEEEARVRRKIDFHLVPVMLIVNGIQFVDKLVCLQNAMLRYNLC